MSGDNGQSKPKKPQAAFEQMCRRAGLGVTPQRTAIYKALIKSKEHPSADMLHKQVRKTLPAISLDTVNRTLLTLVEIGAAFVVEGSGEPRRFDGNLQDHQHFRCVKCRKIIDFHHQTFDNIKVPAYIRKKFKILRTTVYIEGICEQCQKKRQT